MYQLIVRPLAEQDALYAMKWYNEKKEGLGDEFLLVLDAKINAVLRNPEQFQVVHRNVRRALIKRFPYGVFYIIENGRIVVIAIHHTSRKPLVS